MQLKVLRNGILESVIYVNNIDTIYGCMRCARMARVLPFLELQPFSHLGISFGASLGYRETTLTGP